MCPLFVAATGVWGVISELGVVQEVVALIWRIPGEICGIFGRFLVYFWRPVSGEGV